MLSFHPNGLPWLAPFFPSAVIWFLALTGADVVWLWVGHHPTLGFVWIQLVHFACSLLSCQLRVIFFSRRSRLRHSPRFPLHFFQSPHNGFREDGLGDYYLFYGRCPLPKIDVSPLAFFPIRFVCHSPALGLSRQSFPVTPLRNCLSLRVERGFV